MAVDEALARGAERDEAVAEEERLATLLNRLADAVGYDTEGPYYEPLIEEVLKGLAYAAAAREVVDWLLRNYQRGNWGPYEETERLLAEEEKHLSTVRSIPPAVARLQQRLVALERVAKVGEQHRGMGRLPEDLDEALEALINQSF